MGEKLAREEFCAITRITGIEWWSFEFPDTSRTSAVELANHLGLKIPRRFSFLRTVTSAHLPSCPAGGAQEVVRQKLNAIELEFRGKNVAAVD